MHRQQGYSISSLSSPSLYTAFRQLAFFFVILFSTFKLLRRDHEFSPFFSLSFYIQTADAHGRQYAPAPFLPDFHFKQVQLTAQVSCPSALLLQRPLLHILLSLTIYALLYSFTPHHFPSSVRQSARLSFSFWPSVNRFVGTFSQSAFFTRSERAYIGACSHRVRKNESPRRMYSNLGWNSVPKPASTSYIYAPDVF